MYILYIHIYIYIYIYLFIYLYISMRAKPPKEAIASSAGSLGKLFRVRVRGCCVGSDGSRGFRKAATA